MKKVDTKNLSRTVLVVASAFCLCNCFGTDEGPSIKGENQDKIGRPGTVLTMTSQRQMSFGTVSVGAAVTDTLTLTNAGPGTATLPESSAASMGITAPFSLSGGTCTEMHEL